MVAAQAAVIAGYALRERFGRPPHDFPAAAVDLTSEWLTGVLIPPSSGERVVTCNSEPQLSALTTDDRRAWEHELIEEYLGELRAGGVVAPDYDDAWLAYRQQLSHGLIYWLFTIGQGRLQPDVQPREVSEINVRRMLQAATDLDAFAALNGSGSL